MKKKTIYYVTLLLIVMCCNLKMAHSQATSADPTQPAVPANTPFTPGVDFLGWAPGVGVIPLNIRHDGVLAGNDIDFYTGGFIAANKRMTILGPVPAVTAGFVGIDNGAGGFFSIPPLWQLDVRNDINIYSLASAPNPTINSGFRINSNLVLYLPGDNPANPLLDWKNTFVGRTGNLNVIPGLNNTFLGYKAGNQTYFLNVLDNGSFNTFIGNEAGSVNTTGTENTFVGCIAGVASTGIANTFVGTAAGASNTTGTANTSLGDKSLGGIVTGSFNTFIGESSVSPTSTSISHAIALGSNTLVPQDYQMILGENGVWAGIGLSNDGSPTFGPTNSLEINAWTWGALGTPTTIANKSGLSFRQLTANSTPGANQGNLGVLALSTSGEVIYVPNGGGIGGAQNATWVDPNTGNIEWGSGLAPGPFTPLLHNTEVQMIDPSTSGEYNIYFTGQSTLGGYSSPVDIGIGYAMNSALLAKLDVKNETHSIGGGEPYPFNNQYAGRFYQTGDYDNTIASGTDDMIGVYGESDVREISIDPISIRNNIGGDFYASETQTNIGARGTAIGNSYADNIGLKGIASNAKNNYGLWAEVKPPTANSFNVGVYGLVRIGAAPPVGSTNYAVYGDLGIVNPPCFPPPACPTAPDFAGYFNGDVMCTTGNYVLSDAGLKQNIQAIANPMSLINALLPKTYTLNQQANQSMRLAADTVHAGLLAQDVEGVLPGSVKECIHPARYDSLGNQTHAAINFKAINYTEFIPFLIAGMKQMDSTNQAQQTLIDSLLEIVANTEIPQQQQNPNDNNNGNSIDVKLSSRGIVLEQNKPNPYKENTVIEYFIPDDAVNVKIIFTDAKGNVLTEVEIPEKGKGQLNVYAADLSSGIYTYTIVADGITIDTKRMMKTK
ncbi:MAG TPA: tail fiber domain-containing protein [Bacteroidia bacterium]|nr:tail fiber domain-containing protein [Bacteroidia bacterium]